MPYTKVIIKDGKIKLEGIDFKGPACVSELKNILKFVKEMGVEVEIEEAVEKPEYFENVTVTEASKMKSLDEMLNE